MNTKDIPSPITKETLTEIRTILREVKDKKLINKVMTGIAVPGERYVKFDKLIQKVDNLLANVQTNQQENK